jgi:hypothetical protein
MRSKVLILLLLLCGLSLSACWGTKQQFHTTVTNHSTLTLRSIEVDYPGGGYGIAELAPGQSNLKWVFVTPPCKYSMRFVDEHGQQYASKTVDLGNDKCPPGVSLDVDASMNIAIAATKQ